MTAHRTYERFMRRYMQRQDRRQSQAELDRIRQAQYESASEPEKLDAVKKWRRPWWW